MVIQLLNDFMQPSVSFAQRFCAVFGEKPNLIIALLNSELAQKKIWGQILQSNRILYKCNETEQGIQLVKTMLRSSSTYVRGIYDKHCAQSSRLFHCFSE